LRLLKTESGWHEVRLLNGITGWVSAQYVSQAAGNETDETAPTPSPDRSDSADVVEQKRRTEATQAAMTLLDDLSVYLKLHPETPDLASVAEEITKLQQAIQNNNFSAIDATKQQLHRQMAVVAGFADFQRERNEDRRKAEIKALGEAVSLASKHVEFLRAQIAENVTSSSTPLLAGSLKQYEIVLKQPKPDLAILTDLNDRVKQLVAEQNLSAAYQVAMARTLPEALKSPPEQSISEPTDRNRFLMEGERTDWVLLFNSSGQAPHVVRDIRGDVVFENNVAKTCVLHPLPQTITHARVEEILSSEKVETVELEVKPCPEHALQNYDVLIANRGDWLKQPPSYLAPLLGQVEDGRFQELRTLTGAAFQQIVTADAAESSRLENELATGSKSGFGLIRLDNDSRTICMTTSDELHAAQQAMLTDNRKALAKLFDGTPEFVIRTVEAAFLDAKRGQCGAIYGERGDLWETIQGLRRDRVDYSMVPLWFDPQLVSERAEQIRQEHTSEAQEVQNRIRQSKEQNELDQRRQEIVASQKTAREEDLRKRHGPRARAGAEELLNAVKALATGRDSWASREFPEFASWYRERKTDGWEFVGLAQAISDFGTANWKGRSLDVVVTDVSIEMKNRLLGEKKTTCFRLGLIFDTEYAVRRDPFVTTCDGQATDNDWKQARGFNSQWVAQ
jgi:hypothetical protein